MSRPQYNQQSSSSPSMQGPVVVNGGLIDFQDNMHRGVNEYVTSQQLLAAQGYCQHAYAQPGFSQVASLAVGGGAPPMAATSVAASFPGTAYPGISQNVSGACFSGPPSFLHVNGITYKPVDADPGIRAAASLHDIAPDQGGVAATGSAQTTPPNARVMTEDDLHEAIDQRVQSKVEKYLSSQRKHHARENASALPDSTCDRVRTTGSTSYAAVVSRHAASSSSASSPASRSSTSGAKVSMEEARAIERVKIANAKMVSAPGSVPSNNGRSSHGKRW